MLLKSKRLSSHVVKMKTTQCHINRYFDSRVFLNLWFAKPMVCVRVAFHENDGNHENHENDEDHSDSYEQGVECWIRGNHGNDGNDENHENPGCKPRVPQTTGLEIPEIQGAYKYCPHIPDPLGCELYHTSHFIV